LKLKPENLILTGNNIFAAISIVQLAKIFLLGVSVKLPLLNIFSIILGLSCFTAANILVNGLSFFKQFQLFIQLFCWVIILYYNIK